MTTCHSILVTWLSESDIRPIDYAFAQFVEREFTDVGCELVCIAAFLSAQSSSQHVCVPEQDVQAMLLKTFGRECDVQTLIRQCSAVACLSDDVTDKKEAVNFPMIFQNRAFYLQRYWVYETTLLIALNAFARTQRKNALSDWAQSHLVDIKSLLKVLFPVDNSLEKDVDWQKVAVAVAALNPVTFITGGPGTGKTTTVVKLMALLQGIRRNRQQPPLMIKLAAPTGKAAARLSESIDNAKRSLPTALAHDLDVRCTTIHRLMGTRYQSIHYAHNRQNPIHADLIIVDEASMIDLPMMSKLFQAVSDNCQVVLLGDSEQLASVEVGSVLNDICELAQRAKGDDGYGQILANTLNIDIEIFNQRNQNRGRCQHLPCSTVVNGITRLHKSHRFDDKSEIGRLAAAIRMKDVKAAEGLLGETDGGTLNWFRTPQVPDLVNQAMPNLVNYCHAVGAGDIKTAFSVLKQQQVLCSHKRGALGVESLNQALEFELARRALIAPELNFYQCRPIMVTQNSHDQGLFNGDVGIIADDPIGGTTKAWFELGNGELRGILTSRLPAHETVFAMTVHKSQGSEFEQVILCLPYEKSRRVHLTKSMLYTGLTRAKNKLTLLGSADMLRAAMSTEVKRGSGLTERLLHYSV